jgi:hypothetical protein
MLKYPYHQSLRLRNFTAFQDASFEFVSGINALVGTNGTGKTHLLKVLYSYQLPMFRNSQLISQSLEGVLQTRDLKELVRSVEGRASESLVSGKWNNSEWTYQISPAIQVLYSSEKPSFAVEFSKDEILGYAFVPKSARLDMSRPIFIPAIDMMGHTRRFLSTYDEYQIDFDQTHRDIVALLLSPELRIQVAENNTLSMLTSLLGGEVEEENERFYLRTTQGRHPMPLVAEGLRKIATLYQLVKNGYLRPGDTLFWDEPEVNLNPTLMDEVVGILLALARSGVQIFLATHSYVVLQELDLQSQPQDSIRYFALAGTTNGSEVRSASTLAELAPNAISDHFDSLYDRQLDRSIGKRRVK